MGIWPCELCHQRWRGSADHYYFAVALFGNVERQRIYTCQTCSDWIASQLEKKAVNALDADAIDYSCDCCWICVTRDLIPSDPLLFVTSYRNNVRADWLARVHGACVAKLGGTPLSQALKLHPQQR